MPMPADSNNKVTMVVLGAKIDRLADVTALKIDGLSDDVAELKGLVKHACDDINANKSRLDLQDERWKQHEKEHAGDTTKKWVGDVVAAVTGAITGIVALLQK